MSIEYPFHPGELTRHWRWLRQWWPSRRIAVDPLRELRVDGRYAPVSIANWKLISPVARGLLAHRRAAPLKFLVDQRLTVVIPFRDRQEHLDQLLPHLVTTLRGQRVNHSILVVEQLNDGAFNRGRLLNAGMHFAKDTADYFCLHDVDAIPLNANYLCPSQPLRLVNKIVGPQGPSFRPEYYFSGAISIRREQVFAANGYSNEYWGWGKEDDDFFFRLLMAGNLCYFDLHGEYLDLPNPSQQQVKRDKAAQRRRISPDEKQAERLVAANRTRRSRLLRGLEDPSEDGLSTLRYELVRLTGHDGYSRILVRW